MDLLFYDSITFSIQSCIVLCTDIVKHEVILKQYNLLIFVLGLRFMLKPSSTGNADVCVYIRHSSPDDVSHSSLRPRTTLLLRIYTSFVPQNSKIYFFRDVYIRHPHQNSV